MLCSYSSKSILYSSLSPSPSLVCVSDVVNSTHSCGSIDYAILSACPYMVMTALPCLHVHVVGFLAFSGVLS